MNNCYLNMLDVVNKNNSLSKSRNTSAEVSDNRCTTSNPKLTCIV